MKTQRLLVVGFSVLLVCFPASLFGNWIDDFDSYPLGALTPQGGWEGWGGGADAAVVTSTVAASSPNSVAVSGGSDLVQPFTGYTSGQWTLSAKQYVPSTSAGNHFFIMLNNYATGQEAWSIQLPFNMDTGLLNDDMAGGDENVPIITDAWVDLRLEIDLDANSVDSYYNGSLFSTHQWADMGSSPPHQIAIEALDLYPDGAGVGVVYYDDFNLIPEPTTGLLLVIGALVGFLHWRRR